jgi:hypothetical protein
VHFSLPPPPLTLPLLSPVCTDTPGPRITGGNIHAAVVNSLLRLKDMAHKLGMEVGIQMIWNESLIQRARNTLVQVRYPILPLFPLN